MLEFHPSQNNRKLVRIASQLWQFFVWLSPSFYPKFRWCLDSTRFETIGNGKSVRFAPQLWPSVATWRHFAFDRLKTDEGRLIQGKSWTPVEIQGKESASFPLTRVVGHIVVVGFVTNAPQSKDQSHNSMKWRIVNCLVEVSSNQRKCLHYIQQIKMKPAGIQICEMGC